MSTVIVESPSVGSQLYFPWVAAKEATSSEPAAFVLPVAKSPLRARHVIRPERARLSTLRHERAGKPVRVGTVMIKLLKRYGITDDEITEGLQNYAKTAAS